VRDGEKDDIAVLWKKKKKAIGMMNSERVMGLPGTRTVFKPEDRVN
jgi:hypothetical protein